VGYNNNSASSSGFYAATAPLNQDAYLHAAAGDEHGLTDTLAVNRPEAPLSALTSMTSAYPQISADGWELGLEAAAVALLATDRQDVWEELTRKFESRLILAALAATRGRRIEAAQKLGIGRNTITRKIQELGLE
jgi:two-component system nitrogen regulation response regulator GlnG